MTRSTVSVGSRIADVSLGAVIWPLTPCYWSLSISTRTTSLPLRTLLRLLSHDTWIRSGECNQGVSVESEDANNSQSGIDCSEWWKCRNRIVWSGKMRLSNIIFTYYFLEWSHLDVCVKNECSRMRISSSNHNQTRDIRSVHFDQMVLALPWIRAHDQWWLGCPGPASL